MYIRNVFLMVKKIGRKFWPINYFESFFFIQTLGICLFFADSLSWILSSVKSHSNIWLFVCFFTALYRGSVKRFYSLIPNLSWFFSLKTNSLPSILIELLRVHCVKNRERWSNLQSTWVYSSTVPGWTDYHIERCHFFSLCNSLWEWHPPCASHIFPKWWKVSESLRSMQEGRWLSISPPTVKDHRAHCFYPYSTEGVMRVIAFCRMTGSKIKL